MFTPADVARDLGARLRVKLPSMDISVIVATHNRSGLLGQMLASLDRQIGAGGVSWEIIVVDNNSSDDTRDVVESLQHQGTLPNLRYVFEPRQGKSQALNRGIHEASGAVLALTDDDVIVDARWIAAIHGACHRHPEGCFGGKVLPQWPHGIPSWLTTEGPYRLVGGPIVKHDWGDEPRPYDELMYTPIGANLIVRKTVVDRYGGFNTSLGPKGPRSKANGFMVEDSEFCMRLMDAGERCLYLPSALVYHPVSLARLRKSYFLDWYFGAGRALVRMEGLPRNCPTIAGVPRYLFRQLARETALWWSALNRPRRLYCRLRTYHTAGQITQHLVQAFGPAPHPPAPAEDASRRPGRALLPARRSVR